MSSGFGTPARKRRNNKETPPRERAGNTGTMKELSRHQMREQEGKKESSSLSVLRKNFNKEFDELEKQQRGEDFSDDDLGLISYNDDDNNTSFISITDEKEKEEKERRKTLQEKHIKKEKTCTLEDCTITGGTKRRRRSKRRKTNRKNTKKKRGKKAGGVSQRPPPTTPPTTPPEPNNELQRIVRNFNDTIFTIGARIGRNETIYNDEFESIVNVGRGQLNTALLEMFPTEREGPRNRSIRFVNQLRDFVNLQMPPENEIQRLHHGELVRALDDIIGFLSNREDRNREYVAPPRRYD